MKPVTAVSGYEYPAALLAMFAVIFVALGIAPLFRQDWLLENLLVFVALAILIVTRKRLRFSNVSYTLIFVLIGVHEIGAHYTYSLVPYDRWVADVTGDTLSDWLGLDRNHYDRLIHFAYGLLITLPAIELLEKVAPPRGVWRYLLPVLFILSHSAVYELVEYAAAMVFGGELGTAYLGTQGDEWDSQKDMVCALGGALLALLCISVSRRQASQEAAISPRNS